MKNNLYIIKCEQACPIILDGKNFMNNIRCWCYNEFSKFCTGKRNSRMLINKSQQIKNNDVDLQTICKVKVKINASQENFMLFGFGVMEFIQMDKEVNHRKTNNEK